MDDLLEKLHALTESLRKAKKLEHELRREISELTERNRQLEEELRKRKKE